MSFKVLSTLLLIVSGCSYSTGERAAPQRFLVTQKQADVGAGWDPDIRFFTNKCVKDATSNEPKYYGMHTSELSFERDKSRTYVLKDINATMGGGVDAGPLGADLNYEAIDSLSSDEFSMASYLRFNLIGKSEVIEVPVLNNAGREALKKGPEMLRKLCGTEYVKRIDYGAKLFVGYKLHFSNYQLKRRYESKLHIRMPEGIDDLEESIIHADDAADQKHFVVEVVGFQIGGKPQRLLDLISASRRVYCEPNKMAPCQELMDRILAYASNDFVSQLNGDRAKKNYAVSGYVTRPYSDDGLLPKSTAFLSRFDELEAILLRLAEKQTETISYARRVEVLLSKKDSLAAETRTRLEATYMKITANEKAVAKAYNICLASTDALDCILAEKQLRLFPILIRDLGL